MLASVYGWLSGGSDRRRAAEVYARMVDHARQPGFYTACQVPDTVEGRFDMIVLHAFLVFYRLKDQGRAADGFAQRVWNHMIKDIDRNLRELGVGDLSVAKKIKKLARGFYGRFGAYDASLAAEDLHQLEAALHRNVYAGAEDVGPGVAQLAGYVRAAVAALTAQSVAQILAEGPRFPEAPTAEGAA